jgi:hypothetical protein
MKTDFNNKAITVSAALHDLKEKAKEMQADIDGQESKLSDISTANRAVIKNLCEALKVYDITIDPDDLWESAGS